MTGLTTSATASDVSTSIFSIVHVDSRVLGSCYYEHTYEVTSRYDITDDALRMLPTMGIVPSGQEFSIGAKSRPSTSNGHRYVTRIHICIDSSG
jgi:hypothetical protein